MKQKQAFSSVLSTNPYDQSFYVGKINTLETENKPKFLKTQYSISYLKTKSFLNTKIGINKSIDEEDLVDVLENKTYEELGLDVAAEYLIEFYELENEQDETTRFYNVFAVSPEDVQSEFKESIEKIKYIDQIYPAPLLFKSLYKKEILRDNGIDAFIYFQEDDAFITFYKEGDFLFTKELNLSLNHLHEMFCEIYGERVSYENFIELLTQEGLRTSHDENREYLIKLINDILSQISEVINFAKRAYDIEDIHKLYLGSSLGPILGLDEFTQTIIGIEAANLDFEYGFETTEFYTDQMHQLLQLTAQLPFVDRYDCNFTLFHRPPPFVQRESGRLILIMLASLILSLAYPLYNLGYAKFASVENSTIKSEQKKIATKRSLRQDQIDSQVDSRTQLTAKKREALRIQKAQKTVLTKIHQQKVDYPMKAKVIAELTKSLNQFNVQLSALRFLKEERSNKNVFTLNLVAQKDKSITNLIAKLTKENLSQYDISIESIMYDKEHDAYNSVLKVVLK